MTDWSAVRRGLDRHFSQTLVGHLVIQPLEKYGDAKRDRPGWYPDPWQQASLRWWAGRAWTQHLH
jgi:hypothetical protein